MLSELLLFLVELVIGVVFPLYATMRNLMESSPTGPEKFKSWSFYWMVFCGLQSLGWYLDGFSLFTLVKFVLIVYMVAPKLEGSKTVFGLLDSLVIKKVKDTVGKFIKQGKLD